MNRATFVAVGCHAGRDPRSARSGACGAQGRTKPDKTTREGVGQAPERGDGRRHPAPRARVPGDRRPQRRHPRVRHAGLRPVASYVAEPAARRRLPRDRAAVLLPVLPGERAVAVRARVARPSRPTARTTSRRWSTRAAVTSPAPVTPVDVCDPAGRRRPTPRPPAARRRTSPASRPATWRSMQRGTCPFASRPPTPRRRRQRRRSSSTRARTGRDGRGGRHARAAATSPSRWSVRATPSARSSTGSPVEGETHGPRRHEHAVARPHDGRTSSPTPRPATRAGPSSSARTSTRSLEGPGINDNGCGLRRGSSRSPRQLPQALKIAAQRRCGSRSGAPRSPA